MVETLSRTSWHEGGGRLTKKRAELASLLALYAEVVVIVARISGDGVRAVARMNEIVKGPATKQDLYDELAITQIGMPRLAVDLKSLYHWVYAIESFLKNSTVKDLVDRKELERISIFRHKLMVHHAETPMRKRGRVASSHRTWGPEPENFRLMSHPLFQGALLAGHVRKIARLNPYVPGLKEETRPLAKVDLVYRHFNSIPEPHRKWVRNELFGAVGLWSDQPAVLVAAMLQALKDYRTVRAL